PDPAVREAARGVVVGELGLTGAEGVPRLVELVTRLLTDVQDARPSVLAAIGRNERLASLPQLAAAIPRLLLPDDAPPALLPILARSGFSESETLNVLERGWTRFTQPQRLSALEILFARSAILDQGDPPENALHVLRRAVADPSVAVRERSLY